MTCASAEAAVRARRSTDWRTRLACSTRCSQVQRAKPVFIVGGPPCAAQPALPLLEFIETYDMRKLGGADVARLRWTLVWGKGEKGRGNCDTCAEGLFTQLAVTPAGLYILDARMTDAAVESALKGKPSRSEPPKPYKATKQNEGRYLRREDRAGESLVCMGWEALPGAPPCDDTCFGELCISAKNGPVDLNGTWAPENGVFVRDG